MNDRGSNWTFSHWNRGGRGRGGGRRSWRGGRQSFRGSQGSYGNFGSYRSGNRPQDYGNRNYGNRGNQQRNRPKRDTPGKRLSEDAIGVTEYVNDHKGFLGIIKSRYSDFQVSEINEQGQVAKLTDLSPPSPPVEESVDEDEDLLINKYNLEILPMDTWDRINSLAVSEASTERVEIDVSGMTKEQRTKIHDAVKKAFGDSIVGSTVNQNDKKLVRFERYRKGVRIDNRVKWVWPGEYVYFIVHKENCDTMDAAVRIAERLRLNIKPTMLGYAGTKDRRAKTSQWFSLRKVDPRRVSTACGGLRDITLGNYTFRTGTLRLGMLKGNRFRIALRNVTAPDEEVFAACELLKERGFINYYGLQRFGSRVDTPTYHIGLKLLQGNFKEAIASILEERSGPLQEALRAYSAGCASDVGLAAGAALRAFPRRAQRVSIEQRLLKALAQHPNDLQGALNKMARNTRLLYIHSYQSLVWNRAVSERIRRFGLTPAAGDLVPLTAVQNEEELREEDSDSEENDTETDIDKEDGDENKMADDKTKSTELLNSLESSIKEKQKVPVKVLTQEDVDSGKYSVFDIILPLPGYMIEYPPNMKEYYEELITKDGLNMEMKHKFKSYSMSGAYRHVVMRPVEVSWQCARYTDPHADLLLSDRDELEGRTLTGVIPDGKYKALLLTMTLPASCYATMALRELLKVDTSSDNQALQNNYHEKDKTTKNAKKSDESANGEKNEIKVEEESETGETESESEGNRKSESVSAERKKSESENVEKKSEGANVKRKNSESETGEKRKLQSDNEEVEVKKLKQESNQ